MIEIRIRETCNALFKGDYIYKNIDTYLLKSTLIENILKNHYQRSFNSVMKKL